MAQQPARRQLEVEDHPPPAGDQRAGPVADHGVLAGLEGKREGRENPVHARRNALEHSRRAKPSQVRVVACGRSFDRPSRPRAFQDRVESLEAAPAADAASIKIRGARRWAGVGLEHAAGPNKDSQAAPAPACVGRMSVPMLKTADRQGRDCGPPPMRRARAGADR